MWTRLGGANVIARAVAQTASRMNSNNRSQRDIVAVIGTTGVGKSQLAVDLAQHLRSSPKKGLNDAVVLSSDSMQLYEGLPLITNKVTDVEIGGIEHWGINVVRPGEGGSWEIGKWCQEALCKVRSSTLFMFVRILMSHVSIPISISILSPTKGRVATRYNLTYHLRRDSLLRATLLVPPI